MDNDTVQLRFNKDYKLPLDSIVYLKTTSGGVYGVITESILGVVRARLMEPVSRANFPQGRHVELGIVDETD